MLSKIFNYSKIKIYFIFPILFTLLFIWRFSHWRNNAFGDNGYVPLNNNYLLHDIDGIIISLENRNHKTDTINSFSTADKLYRENNFLYISDHHKYHIFDIKNEKLIKNLSISEFRQQNGDVSKLLTINDFHSDYWGWWILLY